MYIGVLIYVYIGRTASGKYICMFDSARLAKHRIPLCVNTEYMYIVQIYICVYIYIYLYKYMYI